MSLSCMFVWMDVCFWRLFQLVFTVKDMEPCKDWLLFFFLLRQRPPPLTGNLHAKNAIVSHTQTDTRHGEGLLFYAWLFPASNRTENAKYTHTFNKPMMSSDRSLMCMRCSVSVTRSVSLHKINQTRARSATCSIIHRGARLAQKLVIYQTLHEQFKNISSHTYTNKLFSNPMICLAVCCLHRVSFKTAS